MAVFNAVFPVLDGQDDAARAFAKELAGPRRDEFNALQAQGDITEEVWTLQQTPMGSLLLVYFKGDVEKALEDVGSNDSEFGKWFRSQVQAISGVDLANDDGPPSETVLDWKA